MKFIYTVLLVLILSLGGFCADFQGSEYFKISQINKPLTPSKNILRLSFIDELSFSDSFYDSNRNLTNFGNLYYTDNNTVFEFEYGATDRISFGFSLPFIYRKLSDNVTDLSGSSFGFGDASFDFKIQFLKYRTLSAVISSNFRFPSGRTNVGDATGRELPLGKGIISITPTLTIKKSFFDLFYLKAAGGYTVNKDAVAQYLKVTQLDSNGIMADIGNKSIDFGDEIHASLETQFKTIDWVYVGCEASFIYRFVTKIQGENVTYFSEDADASLNKSNGFRLDIMPHLLITPLKNLDVKLGAAVPLSGERWPIVDLYNVERFLGYINPEIYVSYYLD